MKNILLIQFFLIIFSANCFAQLGDFQLDDTQNRKYVLVVANPELEGNGIKRMLIGKNYRGEWTDTIKVPVIDLKKDFGGLKIDEAGGGKQTRSMDLIDANGVEWALRSVRKFPQQGMEDILKGTLPGSLVADGISASYPYAVLSVGTLAKAAGVPYFPNTLVYIPDDPALGKHRSEYKNLIAFLELRSWNKDTSIKLWNTEDLVPELLKDASNQVDERAVLRARLLDNFIMDFDRHDGQWEWLAKDSAGKKFFSPVPKDRDQAFFDANGVLPYLLSGKPEMGPIQGLSEKTRDITTFNHSARDFDRLFLIELGRSEWEVEIDRFLSAMTDDVIENAFSKQPASIRNNKTTNIIDILKGKRSSFKQSMLEYYDFLSDIVAIPASNDNEIINIREQDDNSLVVSLEKINDDNKNTLTYRRTFYPSETYEIQLYGLEGNDSFNVYQKNSPIDIRLIGGPGEDRFIANTESKVKIYDVSFENNKLTGDQVKNNISEDPMTNEFRRLGHKYNSSSFGIALEYSFDGGLLIGPSLRSKNTGFRKEPYASNHYFFLTRALNTSSYHFNYDGEFTSIGKNLDLLLNTELQLPTVRTRFYGFGNDTDIDKNKPDEFYRITYSLAEAGIALQHRITPWFKISYGPIFQHLKLSTERNIGKLVADYNNGRPVADLYNNHSFIGGEIRASVDRRNNDLIPARGLRLNLYTRPMVPFNSENETLMQSGGNVSLYTDFLKKNRIILATSFGADHNSGNYFIPQAQYLGFKQNLRGYEYQRFAGDTRAYNNTEARFNFGTVNLYVVKGPFGIFGFHDIARVWSNEDVSDEWHTGYGGGIWMAPFNIVVITAAVTSSKEEKFLPLLSFGFQF